MLSKSKLTRLLISAANDKRIAQYSFKPVPGEDDGPIPIAQVLEQAADIIERFYEDHLSEDSLPSLKSVIGRGSVFRVDKPFVFRQIHFEENDHLEITYHEGNSIRFIRVGKSARDMDYDVPILYPDLSDMYENGFITNIRKKK